MENRLVIARTGSERKSRKEGDVIYKDNTRDLSGDENVLTMVVGKHPHLIKLQRGQYTSTRSTNKTKEV